MKIRMRIPAPWVPLLLVAGLGCLHKPNQAEPDDIRGMGPLPPGDGGQGGGTTGRADGPARPTTERDGPDPGSQACSLAACEAERNDGCCPVRLHGRERRDCTAQCGNGVIEKGRGVRSPEYLSRQLSQPWLHEVRAPGIRRRLHRPLRGSPARRPPARPATAAARRAAPSNDDTDCIVMCGNGAKEGNETCDPLDLLPDRLPGPGLPAPQAGQRRAPAPPNA